MQSKKPKRDPLDDPEFAAFVHKAENGPIVVNEDKQKLTGSESNTFLPWQNRSNSKILKAFMNFSLDQEYIEKLRWYSKLTDQGQQEIIRNLLRPYLDLEIEKIIQKEKNIP